MSGSQEATRSPSPASRTRRRSSPCRAGWWGPKVSSSEPSGESPGAAGRGASPAAGEEAAGEEVAGEAVAGEAVAGEEVAGKEVGAGSGAGCPAAAPVVRPARGKSLRRGWPSKPSQ